MRRSAQLVLVATLALGSGCAGTETGNPVIAGLVSVDAHSSDASRVSIRDPGGALVIEQMWISFGAIGLLPEGECTDAGAAIVSPPLGSADHAGTEVARVELELDRSRFCGLIAELTLATAPLPAGAPAELEGRSIVIRARLADGTPVRIASRLEGDVRLMATAGTFELDPTRRALFVGLDAARWAGELGLATATREPDGSVILDDARNVTLREAFDENVPLGFELYRDEDGDGMLDPAPELIGRGAR